MDQDVYNRVGKISNEWEGIWSTPKLLFGLIDPRIRSTSANVTGSKKNKLALRFVVNCAGAVFSLLCLTWKSSASRNLFWNIDGLVIESFTYFKALQLHH